MVFPASFVMADEGISLPAVGFEETTARSASAPLAGPVRNTMLKLLLFSVGVNPSLISP